MSKRNIDILEGSVFKNMLFFAFPIILTGLLQLLYNAADIVIVGRYAGENSLAAVGATSSITTLLVTLFLGLSIGTNVLVAQFKGQGTASGSELAKKCVHTSVVIAVLGGIFLTIVGVSLSYTLLDMMDTPKEIIDEASLYMTIIFCGMPASLLYNFGAAILRASGDTKTPLIYASTSGIVNVILNLFFVIVMKMGASGVGLATIISQYLSAGLTVRYLMKENSDIKLSLKELKVDKGMLKKIASIGIPSGISGIVFGLSNVIIQSSINTFGAKAVAGNSAAGNIEGFAYVVMNAFSPTLSTFVGQSFGAGNTKRMKKSIYIGCLQVVIMGMFVSFLMFAFREPLLNIYAPGKAEVIEYGKLRLGIILSTYFLCGLIDALVGALRGMGSAIIPTLASIIGICGVRLGWIYTIFAKYKT
ncbi:MAG: MATE family efflux transporter, partial [Clostridia bacterium]|nr:MATE family efflux transporter [Clostridia bacterium]